MTNIQTTTEARLDEIARTPRQELAAEHLASLLRLNGEGLLEVVEKASRQEPPNVEVMTIAGTLALSMLTEPGNPFWVQRHELRRVVSAVFPEFEEDAVKGVR